jgi:amidase
MDFIQKNRGSSRRSGESEIHSTRSIAARIVAAMTDLAWIDATETAALIADKKISPAEAVDAAIARIEALNGPVNAVIRPMFDEARRVAAGALPDGPFRGVPFLLKDLTAAYAGVVMSSGSRWLKEWVPQRDTELVARFKRAGLVVVGKTNTPEFGLPPTTEPIAFGRSKNPWNLEHHTGGSSGGSAVAVATGMVAMAHANDGGGSIRIPASVNGVFGLKPTRARNPLGPAVGDVMNGLVCEHAVTRSVRDSARLLDATSGPDLGDPYPAPPRARPFAEEVGADPGKLRIALTVKPYHGGDLHPDCVAAAKSAAALCEELGHHVEEASPKLDGAAVSQHFLRVYSAGTSQQLKEWTEIVGRAPGDDDIEPLTRAFAALGDSITGGDYLVSIGFLQRLARTVAAFMQSYDVWLTPTLGEPPLKLGELDPQPDMPTWSMLRAGSYVPFTPLCNMTGQPAMSVPLFWNDAGLPIGCHFVGRYGDEATLFRLAAQLEAARPWRDRRPPHRA